MTRKEIENDMKKFCGSGWINRTKLAQYMGYSYKANPVSEAVKGCARYGKKYSVRDVSENIYRGMK